jgi:DNA-directed RNA polymerase subunit E'/Rpb7
LEYYYNIIKMFELLVISDELILKPGELGDFNKTIEDKIKNKYVNKIVSESAGLCVTLKNIVVRDKIVLPGEGSVQLRVRKIKISSYYHR